MAKEKKVKRPKNQKETLADEWDFSDGFGGIPENVSLTKNIGCASNSGDKNKISSKNFPKTD
ncbi:hypothetical protein [Aquiflexum gelatinilyticum]|uniref:Uncharacterized protein n=1 Tax=Aquiflexum gelatinilyticum TaxID=2961943 RepID=A0A9X2P6G0_9BACT|nr:hypothetical protein [Aquiflexum gelatinilyticum]MCR9016267.1 hypothetical protein [Aquiflexum gelatinilyticum]MCS4435640.1 hypothetical protein [Aquiflexum gelatinilyticum]